MGEIKLGVVESRFADIIWENEPLTSRELVERAKEELKSFYERFGFFTMLSGQLETYESEK